MDFNGLGLQKSWKIDNPLELLDSVIADSAFQ